MEQSPYQTSGNDQRKRLVVGWFSFTCCEAIGACACTGQPSTSRNQFASELINERIRWYLSHFDYGKEVKRLNEMIRVDDMVRGCPMKVPSFLETLDKYLEIFGLVEHA